MLECLAYVAIFAMVLNVLMSLFGSSMRMSAMSALALDRDHGVAEIGKRFAEAVRPAYGVVDGIGEYRSDAGVLVLSLPPIEGNPRYAVVGGVIDHNYFAVLEVIDRNGTLEPLAFESPRMAIEGMRFSAEGGLFAIEFRIQRDPEERKIESTLHRAVAAPRGQQAIGGHSS